MIGLAGLGLAGVIATGVGVAQAGTTPRVPPSPGAPYGYGMPGMGGMGGMWGMMAGQQTCLSAAADYLGLSPADLQAQLRAGRSLADVATARGKSVSGLEDAMIAAARRGLDADTTLTAEQRETILTQLRSRIDVMVHATHQAGRGMMGGGHMGGMHW